MHILHDELPMLAPFVCVVCERDPARPEIRVVDTLSELEIDYAHHLEGRKYVCETCIREMATLLGLNDAPDLSNVTHLESKVSRLEADANEAFALLGQAYVEIQRLSDFAPEVVELTEIPSQEEMEDAALASRPESQLPDGLDPELVALVVSGENRAVGHIPGDEVTYRPVEEDGTEADDEPEAE